MPQDPTEYAKKWYKKNTKKAGMHQRKYKYGHCKNYEEVMSRWDDVHHCEICEKPFNDTKGGSKCVDHSGDLIRGIICNTCNRAIGLLGDDYDSVHRAAQYLKDKN